jgi:hypothetical protein
MGDGSLIKRSIALDQIKTVSAVHKEGEYLSYVLTCESDCSYMIQTDSSDKLMDEKRSNKMLFEFYTPLEKSFVPRMTKAILHLIKLHNGNAKEIAYVKAKEVF